MLNLIKNSGTVSPEELGRRLNINPRIVQVMLEDLQRRGILRSFELESACISENCGGCPVSTGCQGIKPRIWEISDPIHDLTIS